MMTKGNPVREGETLIKLLGAGQFGQVFLVQKGGNYIARKVMTLNTYGAQKQLQSITKEIDILKTLNFRYLIHYYEHIYLEESRQYWIDMEYCEGKNVETLLETFKHQKTYLNYRTALRLFINVAMGIQYLHHINIAHRDLKPENIFLSAAGECVIGDVGVSRLVQDNELCVTLAGTPLYMAPEVYFKKGHSLKCDIFSLGLIFYAFCSNDPPNGDCQNHADLIKFFTKTEIRPLPPHIDSRVLPFIKKLLSDQDRRPGINEVLNDPIIREYIDRKVIITEFKKFCTLPQGPVVPPAPKVEISLIDNVPDDSFIIVSYNLQQPPKIVGYAVDRNKFEYLPFFAKDIPIPTLRLSYDQLLEKLLNFDWIEENIDSIDYWLPNVERSKLANFGDIQTKPLKRFYSYQIMNIYISLFRYFGYETYQNMNQIYLVRRADNFQERHKVIKRHNKSIQVIHYLIESMEDLGFLTLQDAFILRLIFDVKDSFFPEVREIVINACTNIVQNPNLQTFGLFVMG